MERCRIVSSITVQKNAQLKAIIYKLDNVEQKKRKFPWTVCITKTNRKGELKTKITAVIHREGQNKCVYDYTLKCLLGGIIEKV